MFGFTIPPAQLHQAKPNDKSPFSDNFIEPERVLGITYFYLVSHPVTMSQLATFFIAITAMGIDKDVGKNNIAIPRELQPGGWNIEAVESVRLYSD